MDDLRPKLRCRIYRVELDGKHTRMPPDTTGEGNYFVQILDPVPEGVTESGDFIPVYE